jgi:hypothetical protein
MKKFLQYLKVLGPVILAMNPKTAPLATEISEAVEAAEATFGPGNGQTKLANVLSTVSESIDVYNGLNPAHPLDKTLTLQATTSGIATTIDAIKVVQGVKVGVPAPVL